MEKEQFDVYCVNTGKTIRVNGGESLLEIYKLANPRLAHRPICAYVNNKTEELKYRVFAQRHRISRYLSPGRHAHIRAFPLLRHVQSNQRHYPGNKIAYRTFPISRILLSAR